MGSRRDHRCTYIHGIRSGKRRRQPSFPSNERTVLREIDDHGADITPPLPDAAGAFQDGFPTVAFVDQSIHKELRTQVPRAPSSRDFHLFDSRQLGESKEEILTYVSSYFTDVHVWLPILHKQQIYAYLETSSSDLPVDVALLFLCIRLLVSGPKTWPAGPRSGIYVTAKQGLAGLEIAGIMSETVLQASLLISLYEIGHGIYPSAFLSAGACVRYSHAIGLGGPQECRLQRPLSRFDHEQSQKLWSAAILLERQSTIIGRLRRDKKRSCTNINYTNSRFTQLGRLAPTHSTGNLPDSRAVQMFGNSETILANSTSSSGQERSRDEGCFVLLVESTKLLGQVLSFISSREAEPAVGNLSTKAQEEYLQLARTIESLILEAEDEAAKYGVEIRSQLCICYRWVLSFVISHYRVHSKGYSSIFALNQHGQMRGYGDGSLQSLSEHLDSSLGLVMDRVTELCEMILKRTEPELQSIPPLLLHSIYGAAKAALLNPPESSKGLESIFRNTLQRLNTRWKVAGVYIESLETLDVLRL
ncbi:unnamed protein product [Clonostachys byssicola]|uniref:Xylanolytic transcriptional activator regulatory domain-containing protein n=1 Tax=Clonostachys byssicola TaxID=160290 RepID=A0A9N9U831_9HYPO|nr:unnamed protein product [Clonostachys byssicola]